MAFKGVTSFIVVQYSGVEVCMRELDFYVISPNF